MGRDNVLADLASSVDDMKAEIDEKQDKIQQFLSGRPIDGLLVSRHENIAWATAGTVDMRVGILRENAIGTLLFTRGGPSYYLTTNNEATRLEREEFAHLDYRAVVQPWYAKDVLSAARNILGNCKIVADDPSSGTEVVSMQPLRLPLMDGEMLRYRWLGRAVAETVTDVLLELRPGMTELEMQARVSRRLLAQNVLPSVFLTAVDDRIRNYRHAVPRRGILERFGMLNLCARRWGLTVSITRYVHFGIMAQDLQDKFSAVAKVNAALLHATQEGATADHLFRVAKDAYAGQGYLGQEEMHHQGGATGYTEREWVARPGGTEKVLAQQAFAWNPSLPGAKVEDTVVLSDGNIEILTGTPRLPVVTTPYMDSTYTSAGVLSV